jgi:glycine cleavage system aminomethyltransferase T/glycine/D-amino acid oxidase-like deaminating enzyme
MRSEASVVIIGGGIVGCSVAYHLAHRGVSGIVLLEQDRWPEPGGSTSHASDFIFPLDASRTMTTLSNYGIEIYSQIQFNGRSCFKACGGLEIARTEERMGELQRKIALGKSWGVPAELVSPEQAQALFPWLDPSQILGAMWEPTAGLVMRSVDAAQMMVREAEAMGAVEVYPYTPVTGIDVQGGRVCGVRTPRGDIAAETVVSAVGVWGPLIGQMAGITIPLAPMHHQLVHTTPAPELAGARDQIEWPLLRDQDRALYVRQERDTWEIGSYQHRSMFTEPEEIPAPDQAKLTPTMMPFTVEDFVQPMADIVEVMPVLADASIRYGFNGLLSVTPDGLPVLGEVPGMSGLWSAEAVWVKDGSGAGKLIADWMLDGHSEFGGEEVDFSALDVARFYPHQRTRTHIRSRASEGFQKVYGIIHPREQWASSRDVRRSPFFPRQVDLGAEFFETAGWERPHWYSINATLLEEYPVPPRSGWEAMWWSSIAGAEHQAVRDRVGMVDLSSFIKLEVSGPGALDYLQRLAAAQVDRPVGSIVYTPLLTPRGKVKSDLTITRLGEDRFLVVTGAGMGMLDTRWMLRHLPPDGSVELVDRTASMCVVGLWGPRARHVLQAVTETDVSNAAFPFMTALHLEIGAVPVLALRVSYVGELGWEIYAPVEQGLRLWDTLWEAGEPHGLVAVGLSGYLSSLRIEKANLLLGADIQTEYDVYESDLARPRIKSAGFIGKEAVQRIREQGVRRKICTLTVDSGQVVMANETPVLEANGNGSSRWLGYVHSADYGYSVDCSLALAYLPVEYAEPGTPVKLLYRGETHPATVAAVGTRGLFDPDDLRMKR